MCCAVISKAHKNNVIKSLRNRAGQKNIKHRPSSALVPSAWPAVGSSFSPSSPNFFTPGYVCPNVRFSRRAKQAVRSIGNTKDPQDPHFHYEPKQQTVTMSNPIGTLPEVLTDQIWEYVGFGNYRYIAAVHPSFKRSYTDFWWERRRYGCRAAAETSNNQLVKITFPSRMVESVACAELYVKDCDGNMPSWQQRRKLWPKKSKGKSATWKLKESKDNMWDDILHLAALYGKRDVLDHALNLIPKNSKTFQRTDICRLAALGGDLSTLEYARLKKSLRWDGKTCSAAAEGGHVEIIRWALSNRCQGSIYKVCGTAAQFGHSDIIKLCAPMARPTSRRKICEIAAENGHLEVVQECRAHGFRWDPWTCAAAAENGHLKVLIWLRAHGCPWDYHTYISAARNGHLNVLRWARDNQCPWGSRTCCQIGVCRVDLTVLTWLTDNGCPWYASDCCAEI